jgi:predicted RNase H-like nuclease (RuvC/YqgF family)
MGDHFTNLLFEGEDLTFKQYQELRQARKKEAKLEAEALEAEVKETKRRDEAFFNEMLTLDAKIEAFAVEKDELDTLRATITKQYDTRELQIRQEWHEARLRFDQLFRRFNNGRPYSRSDYEAIKFVEKLKAKGAKLEMVELLITRTPLSPSAQKLWDEVHKPELPNDSTQNAKYMSLVLGGVK